MTFNNAVLKNRIIIFIVILSLRCLDVPGTVQTIAPNGTRF